MSVRRSTMSKAFLSIFFLLLAIPSQAVTGDPVLINEALVSHTGTDNTEYVELYGAPGASLAGLSLIAVEGDDGAGVGTIDRRIDFKAFHQLGSNGFFLVGNCTGLATNYTVTPDKAVSNDTFENSSLTLALVETASLSGSTVSGSEVVLDSVALRDTGVTDVFFFGAPVLGPDGSFFPAGVRRVTNGVDTDTTTDWVLANFNLGGTNTPTGGGFNGCAPLTATIPEIQGSGQRSPLEGEQVATTGVVTLYTANGDHFWLQAVPGDDDPTTSDGIFVNDGGTLSTVPAIGDLITITAKVEELQFGNALPLTRLTLPSNLVVQSTNNPLPPPIALTDLPNASIADGIAFWEPLEGMLVSVSKAPIVSPTSRFGEFALLTKKDTKTGSGYFSQTDQLLVRSLGGEAVDYNPERILVDDSSLASPIVVRPGDLMQSLVGVVDYTFGNYKLQPVEFEVKTRKTPRSPVSQHSGPKGDTTFTTFNVENLFDLIDEPGKDDADSTPTPEQLEAKLTKLSLAIREELKLPEIMVIEEVENSAILQTLGDRVNSAAGTNYVATSFDASDGRGIEVGFLWDSARVSLVTALQLSGPDVEAAFGPSSESPGREPLVGVFEIEGKQVTIIGNHFKSKGGDDPLFGVNDPPLRTTETQRKLQARVVRDYVNTLLAADPDALVMVAGDLNDFSFTEPGEGVEHPVGIVAGGAGEVLLTDLADLEKEAERFTFVFDGNSQVLDHMLVSPALMALFKSVNMLHFNAGFPAILGDDTTTTLHVSDHDPIEARFAFRAKRGR